MDCREVKRSLPAFLESDLSEDQRSQIRDHLTSCASCAQEMKQIEAAWEALGQWEEVSPSPLFKKKFWEKIADREGQKAPKGWTSWGWRVAWVPVGSLAAVLLAAFLWLFWSQPERTGTIQLAIEHGKLVELAASMELLEHKELVEEMDLLEEFELLLALEDVSETPDEEG